MKSLGYPNGIMEAQLILAEAATAHPDQTVSMLRSGINSVKSPNTPVIFRGCLVARIEATAGEHGSHNAELNCIDADGRERVPPIRMQFDIPTGGGQNVILLNLNFPLKDFGIYAFNLLIDNLQHASWTLKAEQITVPNANN